MKNIHRIIISVILIFLILSCTNHETQVVFVQPTAYPSALVAEYFPLSKGAYWVYEGAVKWQTESDVFEQTIQWKMEVLDVIQRNDIIGYKMKGAPWDLTWYEHGKQPGEYAFIKVGTGRFYIGTLEDFERMMDEEDLLGDLVGEYSLFLEIPLLPGKRFCDTPSITRTDMGYCWIVNSETKVDLANVKGVRATDPLTEFALSQSTLPDFSMFHFVPGIGITRYEYVHHGTVAEVDVSLIEYHSGK